ncbi:hypothetical protein [Chryseobacterium sp. MMS23-Vi53]|uniref:hypothetical protein n=1 Tax=Chryseobacterium sp. MMS23-Vi53 TaxID=3386644 RepID=UPI0039EA5EBC
MKNFLVAFSLILLTISCKTKMNQYTKIDKIQKRDGKWREEYSADDGILIAIGRYRKGEKVGTWKTYFEDKLYEKNKIRKDVTKIKRYFPDGKLMESGQSRLDISKSERHWYYIGDWKYYSKEGRLLYKKTYYLNQKTDSISYINGNSKM